MAEPHDELVGKLVLGRYRVMQLLARGGMAAVFLARVEGDAGFSKPVVVKRILPHLSSSADDQARFIREAQLLSNLRHPGIVNVIDFGRFGDSYIMVLEYVHGYHLGEWLKYSRRAEKVLPWYVCVYVMAEVLSALHHAHTYTRAEGTRAPIIHRDISPSNILVDVGGSVRLADFGIARIETEQTTKEPGNTCTFLGKLPYAAPEIFESQTVSALTDIYACGVVLYQLLAGTNPFNGDDAASIIHRVLTVVPDPISHTRPEVPKSLDEVLAMGIARKPEGRYQTARDFAAALRAVLPRPESEVAGEFAALVRRDFTGDLPRILGRESLESLERTWHRIVSETRIPLNLSAPPTIRVGPKNVPSTNHGSVVVASKAVAVSRAPWSVSRTTLSLVLAGGISAVIASAVMLLLRPRTNSAPPQYLIVESRNSESPEEGGLADASALSTTHPSLTGSIQSAGSIIEPAASSDSKSLRASASPRDPVAALSRTFSRQHGAIQSCFEKYATNIEGTPEVSIRFSVNPHGEVLSASISPSAIAGTPLGSCIERVARATNFGPQEKPIGFSIPITARTHR